MMRATSRTALRILVATVALVVAWQALTSVLGWKARFGESNYMANRIRLEDYLLLPAAPRHVLVGSSLSGRLLPEFFSGTSFAGFQTLGLDGSIPLVGLEALSYRPDLPSTVFIETYLMEKAWSRNDQLLIDGLASPGMTLAKKVPVTQASHRPSSILYSAMKARRDGAGAGVIVTNDPSVREPGPAIEISPADPKVAERWRRMLKSLSDRGVRAVLVDLPSGEVRMPGARTAPDLADVLAREFGLTRIDLRKEWFERGWRPTYTDGRHLDGASARATARMLSERKLN
jgi:hypothetical protein